MLVLVDLTKNILGIYIYIYICAFGALDNTFYSAIVDFIFSFSLFQLNAI